jgi:hydroxymethylpyrimidine pyrophosphatase-like HAD family hydrolase
MRVDADKGSGVHFLCSYLNVDVNDIAVIGDNHNDISMFNETNCSVCMKNGDELAKSAATFVTKNDNDNGGWCEAVNWALEFHSN